MGTSTPARTLDVLAVVWVALWVVAALALGSAAWGLGDVTDAARQAASGTDQAGRAVEQLGDLPLVPDRVGELGVSIRESAASLDVRALDARSSIHRLAVALAVAVFALATSPVWLVHLPLRARRARTVRAVRAFLGHPVAPGRAEAWLAQRAVVHLPPDRLLAITDDPVGDLAVGRHDALARAELARLGMSPSLLGPAPVGAVPAGRVAASVRVADDTSWDA